MSRAVGVTAAEVKYVQDSPVHNTRSGPLSINTSEWLDY
jgi:hypothetical protein